MTPLTILRSAHVATAALLLVGSFLAFAAACNSAAATPPTAGPPPAIPVGAKTAIGKQVQGWNDLTGRVEAVSSVEIRPRVSGPIVAVNYREGATVKAGDLLFSIDPRPYQATLARAQAELAHAQARASLAHIDAGRADKLLDQSAIPRAERDTLASGAAQADADVRGAQAAVELARLDVEFTQVRAPSAGRTGQALVVKGDYVVAGPPAPTLLTTLVSEDPVYVYFTGDEATYLRLHDAEHTRVQIGLADERDLPHAGTVDFVDNRLDPATGTIRLRAVVPNTDHRLAPGLYARVRLPEGTAQPAVLVDDKAVLTDQDRKFVYVVAPDGTAQRRDVTLGRIVDGLRIVTGVKAGEQVIVDGTQKIGPGAHVQAGAMP
ncbi:MAG TPA: efflux RND transporter periplasmic adaptor subunit [Kofleriaceae bacterium]|jgi:multidrug efflux system membrane fusion protein